jgi:hypothetical protein
MNSNKVAAIVEVLLLVESELSDGYSHYTPWRYGDKQPESKTAHLVDIARKILTAIDEVQDE